MKRKPTEHTIEKTIERILDSFPERNGATIPLLQKIQEKNGYLSPEVIRAIAEALELSESEVYGVATFYSEFKLRKPGRHHIKVCMGTSCYLHGGKELLGHISRRLNIKPGRTTKDEEYSLETVACLGCCSKSPVIAVDGVIYGGLSPAAADEIVFNSNQKPLNKIQEL